MNVKTHKSGKYQWTRHSLFKMRQYGLSPQRVIRVIRNPERVEAGIAKKTIAVMQPSSIKRKNFKKTWSSEIWAMYQVSRVNNFRSEIVSKKQTSKLRLTNNKYLTINAKHKYKIISAWRYPGISPRNNPIPKEILAEIENEIKKS